jgi:xanthine dehydrogenase YagR molybdenum-binding subunit
VAATTRSIADEALRLIEVKYEVLPFVVDMDEARRREAPSVFEGADLQAGGGAAAPGPPQVGNVRGPATANSFYGGPRGNAEQGFREASVIVEGEFRTQVQTHCCLEPHAVVADWRGDGLTLYISTQDTAGVRKDVAAAFGLPLEKVRVITEFMGGGFGSKLGVGDYVIFAVELSRKASAPVSLIFDREEEQLASGNRPGRQSHYCLTARPASPQGQASVTSRKRCMTARTSRWRTMMFS